MKQRYVDKYFPRKYDLLNYAKEYLDIFLAVAELQGADNVLLFKRASIWYASPEPFATFVGDIDSMIGTMLAINTTNQSLLG